MQSQIYLILCSILLSSFKIKFLNNLPNHCSKKNIHNLKFCGCVKHGVHLNLATMSQCLRSMVVSKNKEFLFFCFLKFFVFLQKMGTKNKTKKKISENSWNKRIQISYLNRFYTKMPFELIATWSVVCNLAKKIDFSAF